jgi:tRNA pseudouridine38-40 synthase
MTYNYLLKLRYRGNAYLGFRKSKEGKTIESVLEEVLLEVKPLSLQGASRTDKGVHAEEQAVTFLVKDPIDEQSLFKTLQKDLPSDIKALELKPVPLSFHPSTTCIKKRYRYQFSLGTPQEDHYQIDAPLDLNLLSLACKTLEGTHNFYSFACRRHKYSSFEKTLYEVAYQLGPSYLHLYIEGNSFLYKMVRNLAYALIKVSTKSLSLADFQLLITDPHISPHVQPLPSNALFLEKLYY